MENKTWQALGFKSTKSYYKKQTKYEFGFDVK
jgi:hypothetical protein